MGNYCNSCAEQDNQYEVDQDKMTVGKPLFRDRKESLPTINEESA
jgi:hypothetical protein